MINRALEFKDALILYFIQVKMNRSEALDEDDWKLMEEMSGILKHLYIATKELSAEKTTTLSKVIPMINILLNAYSPSPEFEIEESSDAKELRNVVYESLKARFSSIESEDIYSNATIFDPRFKNLVFTTQYKAKQAVCHAKSEAIKVASEDIKDHPLENNESTHTNEIQVSLLS